jgi:hypothetical protein
MVTPTWSVLLDSEYADLQVPDINIQGWMTCKCYSAYIMVQHMCVRKSWIRIRIMVKIKVCRPVFADSPYFNEEQNPYRIGIRVKSWIRIRIRVKGGTDPYRREKSDPDPHQSEKMDPDPDPHQRDADRNTGNLHRKFDSERLKMKQYSRYCICVQSFEHKCRKLGYLLSILSLEAVNSSLNNQTELKAPSPPNFVHEFPASWWEKWESRTMERRVRMSSFFNKICQKTYCTQ